MKSALMPYATMEYAGSIVSIPKSEPLCSRAASSRAFPSRVGPFSSYDVRRWCADAGRPTRFKPSSPSPTDAVRDGSAKLGHPVQNVTREHGLTLLPR